MNFPLLPSLKDDSQVAIPQNGVWHADEQNTLGGLVNSLKVKADKRSSISSIPDVWARPVLMYNILSDNSHPQYEQYVQEWRGILGIMAMRKMRGLSKIALSVIEVPEVDKLKDNDPVFLKVIARSIPDDYLEKQNDATLKSKPGIQAKIQMLTYDDKPLAIVWPSLLICPAVGLENYQPPEVPWWKGNGLNDPITYLSTDEKNSLYAWLQNIIDFDGNPDKNSDEALNRLLTAFRDDVQESLGEDFQAMTLPTQTGHGLGITGVCQIIDQPIVGVIDENFLSKSQVLLKKQRPDKKVPNLLVVTPDLDKQWNMSESEIVVGGYLNASTCLHKGSGIISESDHNKLGDVDLTAYDAEIHMADEFFTDKIAVFYRNYNAFPNALGNRVYNYGDQSKINIIFPIRQRLLDYLTPAFIAEHIHIEIQNRDIKATLDLPVSGPDGKGKLITATKIYQAAKDSDSLDDTGDIFYYDNLPLVQIWPNIRLREPNAWQAYFTYFDKGDTNDGFHMRPWYDKKTSAHVRLPDSAAEVIRGTSFPEAMLCENISKNYSSQITAEEVGILLLNQGNLDEISTQNSQCEIGIDFGTTNTTAYMRVDNETPHLITFKNRKFYVTYTNDAESITGDDKTLVRQNFISEQEQPGKGQCSIKSMYHDNPELMQANPFFSGNIYCLDQASNVREDDAIIAHIKTTEMKWDQEKGLEYMLGFLMQLCLQCMVEAISTGANSLQWTYSYPKSFSLFQLGQYQSTWNTRIMDIVQKACTIPSTVSDSMSESEATAEFFKQDMRASMRRGILCFDIGGGSTDIAVWQETPGDADDLLNQTSLKFAGRNILNDYLWQRKEKGHDIFAKLRTDDKSFNHLLNDLSNEKSKHRFDLLLEALLRDYEKPIFKSLPTKAGEPEISLLIRDISFALSGIFFYSGMIIGYLRKSGKYDKRQLLPNCYVGGNASKLLNWAAGGQFNGATSLIGKVFRQSLLNGIQMINPDEKLRPNFEFNMTDRPKQEVAYGLVVGESQSPDLFDFEEDMKDGDVVLAGEVFSINHENQESPVVTAQDYVTGIQIDICKPAVFQRFLSGFNRMMNVLRFKPIEFTENDFTEICTQVNQELSDMQADAHGDILNVVVEPVFILVLKEAYLQLSKSGSSL